VRGALEEAFAVSSRQVVDRLESIVSASGRINLMDLPVDDARSLLFALCAVESVRGESDRTWIEVARSPERRENGVFEANNFRFARRTSDG
jgi:hypothetical protein